MCTLLYQSAHFIKLGENATNTLNVTLRKAREKLRASSNFYKNTPYPVTRLLAIYFYR